MAGMKDSVHSFFFSIEIGLLWAKHTVSSIQVNMLTVILQKDVKAQQGTIWKLKLWVDLSDLSLMKITE